MLHLQNDADRSSKEELAEGGMRSTFTIFNTIVW